MKNQRVKGNILLFITAIIWGLAFTAQRLGGEILGAFSFNSIRFLLGALSLIPIIIFFNTKSKRDSFIRDFKNVIPAGILLGFVLFLASALQQFGIMHTSVGNTAFITGLYLVFVPLMGIFFKHKLNKQICFSSLIAVIGLYFLTIDKSLSINSGDLLVLIGALFWAVHILLISHFVKIHDALKISFVQFLSCSFFSGIMAICFETTNLSMVKEALVPLLYGGFMSVGIAYTLQVVGQKYAKPSHSAIILSLETVFGALGAAIILSEKLSPGGYLGAGLMFSGMMLSQINFPVKMKS